MDLTGFANWTLRKNSDTRPGCKLPDYGIKENKVGFRGCRFSTEVEKWKNKVLKKTIFLLIDIQGLWGYRTLHIHSHCRWVKMNPPVIGTF